MPKTTDAIKKLETYEPKAKRYSLEELDKLRCEILAEKRKEEYRVLEQLQKELKNVFEMSYSKINLELNTKLIDSVFNKYFQSSNPIKVNKPLSQLSTGDTIGANESYSIERSINMGRR